MPQPHVKKLESPSVSLVIFGLCVTYVGVCGLTSLWLGTLALLLSVLLLLLQVAIAASAFDLRHPSMPWLLFIWVLTVFTAASVGVSNHRRSYAPYLTAKEGRFYKGVGPDALAAVLMDAGVVSFEPSMVLDDNLAVGLKLAGSTYCAAPIMSADLQDAAGAPPAVAAAPAPAPAAAAPGASAAAGAAGAVSGQPALVQFWAIGKDCCSSRGGFVCGDAGEASARSGLVLLDPGAAQEEPLQRERYMRAVEAVCALHDLQTVDTPLLLRWVEDPKSELMGMYTRALLVWIVSSIVYGIVASVVCFVSDYYFENSVMRGSLALGELGAGGARPNHPYQQPYDPHPKAGPLP